MKYSILLAIVIFFLSSTVSESKPISIINQDTLNRKGAVIYINQPFGLINKVRLKVGYKFEKNSTLLLVFNEYYNFTYNGNQIGIEYQYVFDRRKKVEIFTYCKAGYGNYSDYSSGNYLLLGGGIGQEFYLNKSKTFSIQFNEGVKVNRILNYVGAKPNYNFVLPDSPGSFIDLNINFGIRF